MQRIIEYMWVDRRCHENIFKYIKTGLTLQDIVECLYPSLTSAHILCQCEALASIRHAYLVSHFLEPEDIRSQKLGAIWRFSKAARLP
jgi:hypothetical protein